MTERFSPVRQVGKFISDATGVGLLAGKFEETAENEWPKMSPGAKAGAVAANAISLARLVREIAKFNQPDEDRDWRDTIADAVWAASDKADGEIARRTGGKTAFGGAMDSLVGDKIPRWSKEFAMARRGRISPIHPAVRLVRDLAVTWYRKKITEETNGEISVDATPQNDPFSGKWSTANYLVGNALLDSPLGAKMPPWARETVATLTTTHLVVTGIANIYRLNKMKRDFRGAKTTAGFQHT